MTYEEYLGLKEAAEWMCILCIAKGISWIQCVCACYIAEMCVCRDTKEAEMNVYAWSAKKRRHSAWEYCVKVCDTYECRWIAKHASLVHSSRWLTNMNGGYKRVSPALSTARGGRVGGNRVHYVWEKIVWSPRSHKARLPATQSCLARSLRVVKRRKSEVTGCECHPWTLNSSYTWGST